MVSKKDILKALDKIKNIQEEIIKPISKENAIKRIQEKSKHMYWITYKRNETDSLKNKFNFVKKNVNGTLGLIDHAHVLYGLHSNYLYPDVGYFGFDSIYENIIVTDPHLTFWDNKDRGSYDWSNNLKGSFDNYLFEDFPRKNIFLFFPFDYKEALKTMKESCTGRIESLNWK